MRFFDKAGLTAHPRPAKQGFRLAILATIVPLVAAWLLSRWLFDLDYAATALLLDVLLILPAMLLASRAVRGPVALLVLGAALAAAFVFSHAAKIAFLGVPVSFFDVPSGFALLQVLPGSRLVLAVCIAVVFFAALAWALWPRKGGWAFLPAMIGYFVALVAIAQPIAWLSGRLHGDSAQQDAVARVRQDGGTLFLFHDLGSRLWSRVRVHDAGAIADAVGDMGPAPQLSDAPYRTRNIHLFLLEAFWDPTQLDAYTFSRDPLDPRFRALWRKGGESTVLSPVFGGATANAEFEALCGLPAIPGEVVFEQALTQSIPCMPRVLREAGYLAVASHPYQSDYWNRDEAYPRLGFERYNAIGAFELDDMDGMFLNDASTYRQILARSAQLPDDRPRFSYVVSLSTHYPFGRNRDLRPKLVDVSPEAALLETYANALAYSSSAFMDYVEAIRAKDPEALIVAFGDHAPVLGVDPDPYGQSGISIHGNSIDHVRISQTPLLVIDGPRGSVPMGAIPLYTLPSRMLSLLGRQAPNLPYAGLASDDAKLSRKFMGSVLVRQPDGWHVCKGPRTADCIAASNKQERLGALRDDLIRGDQASLDMLDAKRYAGDVSMQRNDMYGECALKIAAWGPSMARVGTPFNVQPSGRSAIWLNLEAGRGAPVLLIGKDEATVTIRGAQASASYRNPEFLKHPGRYPVRYRCGNQGTGEETVAIGTFIVKTIDQSG